MKKILFSEGNYVIEHEYEQEQIWEGCAHSFDRSRGRGIPCSSGGVLPVSGLQRLCVPVHQVRKLIRIREISPAIGSLEPSCGYISP